jgi:uncharacterized protein YqhQ
MIYLRYSNTISKSKYKRLKYYYSIYFHVIVIFFNLTLYILLKDRKFFYYFIAFVILFPFIVHASYKVHVKT